MMSSRNWSAYIAEHIQSEITVGKGGASVFLLDDHTIAKQIQRTSLSEENWVSYWKEALFYQTMAKKEISFLPQVIYQHQTDREILLILKQYRPLLHHEITSEVLDQLLYTLASFHALPIPEFLPLPPAEPNLHDPKALSDCLSGWLQVVAEHPNTFDPDPLHQIFESFHQLQKTFHSHNNYLTHGDFHCDNLLVGQDGKLILCDFQGIGVGDVSGDLAFFLSRLAADGYPLLQNEVITTYCRHANNMGIPVHPDQIRVQMAYSALSVAFLFWHHYLHLCDKDRVRTIYEKMLSDYQVLSTLL